MPIYKHYNQNFFKEWSNNMSYILGFLFADGNIIRTKRGTHFVAFHTADKDLLVGIKRCVDSQHKLAARKSKTGTVYRLQIGSRIWFDDLLELGLTPNKARRMCFPVIPRGYFGDFLRGYFDGDGNVWTGIIHKNRKSIHQTLQVAFTSASNKFLAELLVELRRRNVAGGSLRRSSLDTYSRLSFSKTDALLIEEIMYNGAHKLHLPRKKQIFKQFDNCGRSSIG